MAGNKKDPEYIVLRLFVGNDRLDRRFKAQRFDARADARTFASDKNASRRTRRYVYVALPCYPGAINRKK